MELSAESISNGLHLFFTLRESVLSERLWDENDLCNTQKTGFRLTDLQVLCLQKQLNAKHTQEIDSRVKIYCQGFTCCEFHNAMTS